MQKLIIVSNKLPFEVTKENNGLVLERKDSKNPSKQGIFFEQKNWQWVGRLSGDNLTLSAQEEKELNGLLEAKGCHHVKLTEEQIRLHSNGFCTRTIWPLFHYFPHHTELIGEFWEGYVEVNRLYANEILRIAKPNDNIWIHDYHFMLLPGMLREARPELTIGFFLHIPFPSYELFRMLPWRKEIVGGLLGADLIGFHTFDYERHFMSSVRRLLGYDNVLNTLKLDERVVKVDNFPLGVDYNFFVEKATDVKQLESTPEQKTNEKWSILNMSGVRLMLSVDRHDYTKGIVERLEAFDMFLAQNKNYHSKISMALFVIPSREAIAEYQEQKRIVDEMVGRINGQYGTVGWVPIWYFYRNLTQEEQVELYTKAQIALLTPLRDGMNLIAKGYMASRTDGTGVLILSETTGAAKEMSEALLVNPSDIHQVANAIKEAIEMPIDEQKKRNEVMRKRLEVYNDEKWLTDYLNSLKSVKALQETHLTHRISERTLTKIRKKYNASSKRIIFLDYDGTLTGFHNEPQKAVPNDELYSILNNLLAQKENRLVIISGRDKETLGEWFKDYPSITFVAEHGVWQKKPHGSWEMIEAIDKEWMDMIRPIITFYADRTPRSFLEEKNYSLVWHYRNADPDLGVIRAWELKDELRNLISNLNLEIMDGDKVIEIKNSGINKGRAAALQLAQGEYDFIMAIGDDWTDEYTFAAMPENAFTIKVGTKSTKARFYIDSVESVRSMLALLGQEG